jgi:hypothetical protein
MRKAHRVCLSTTPWLALFLALPACSPIPRKGWVKAQIDELISNYEQKNLELAKRQKAIAKDPPGVRGLTVESEKGEWLVSADLRRAPLDVVIRKCLTQANVSFLIEGSGPYGRVTAHFSKKPLAEALNLLMEPFGCEAIREGEVVVIRDRPLDAAPFAQMVATQGPAGPQPAPTPSPSPPTPSGDKPAGAASAAAAPGSRPPGPGPGTPGEARPLAAGAGSTSAKGPQSEAMVYRVITPMFLTAEELQKDILTNVFGPSNPNISFGVVPETNQLFLYGKREEVSRGIRMIRDADEEPAHVYFEGLIVSLTTNASELLGSALQSLSYKQYSNVNLAAGFPSSPIFSQSGYFSIFRDSLQQNPLRFNALIDALVNVDQARILSRPYLMTLSGSKATLDIGNQGYVQVKSGVGAQATTTSSEPIKVGTLVSFSPTALPDGTIRLEIDMTQSQLEPASQQLNAEVRQSQAKTVLQVRDGESLLIGGLNLQTANSESFGFPYLEKIPLFNFFFRSFFNDYLQNQVFFYVTPRIWRPSLDLPINPAPQVPNRSALDALDRPYE